MAARVWSCRSLPQASAAAASASAASSRVGEAALVVEGLRRRVGGVPAFAGVELAVGPRRAEVVHLLGVEVHGLGDGGLPVPAVLGHLPADVALAALHRHVADGAGVGKQGVARRHGGLGDAPLLGVEGRARRASLQAVRLVLAGDEVLAPCAGVDVEVGEFAQQPQLAGLEFAPPFDERAPGLARELGALGIIPAGAGKSGKVSGLCSGRGDHPRGCGEKPARPPIPRPPSRIIPAGAGKSRLLRASRACAGDHPRGCGEKFNNWTKIINS